MEYYNAFLLNLANIVTVIVWSHLLLPEIKCSLMFLLNICLEICCDIFRFTLFSSDIIHATPIRFN